MTKWEERWESTTAAHNDIISCARRISDLVGRLDGACMHALADLVADVPERLHAASKCIRCNAAEEVSEKLEDSQKFAADIVLALLDNASPKKSRD